MKRITFNIVRRGWDRIEPDEAEGYQLTPNFACHKDEWHRPDHPWVLTHIGSGMACFWHTTRAACLADAEKLETLRTPSGGRFHWETVTVENSARRLRSLGHGAVSRCVGRDATVQEVG